MKYLALKSLLLTLLTTVAPLSLVAGNLDTANRYETGFTTVTKLARDLHRALEPQNRQLLAVQPVLKVENARTLIQPGRHSSSKGTVNTVMISDSCVLLINTISHAKAIDAENNGYFKSYMDKLSSLQRGGPLPVLPNASDPNIWALDTMNIQLSSFNQIMGALVAIDMSHHYLGHYAKYASRLEEASRLVKPVSINAFLTQTEWRNAVMRGGRNALDCGLGVEGFKSLLIALDKMPIRPEWTVSFSPAKANTSSIVKELQKMENSFFLVDY